MRISLLSGAAIGLVASILLAASLVVNASRGAAEPARLVSPEQLLIVRDGSVSEEEYLSAAQAMVGCLRKANVGVSDPERGPQGLYGYHYLDGAESLDVVQGRASVVQGCYQQNLGEVDRVKQLSPEHQQSAEEIGFSIQRCVESRKSGFLFSGDNELLIRQVVALQNEADADFEACWSKAVRALFAATGQAAGRVDIAYHPLPR